MRILKNLLRVLRELRRVLAILAQPAKGQDGSDWTILAYRGFAVESKVFLTGRVFKQKKISHRLPKESILADLIAIWHRISRKGLGNALVSANFNGQKSLARTDRYGFFQIRLTVERPLIKSHLWQPLQLRLIKPASTHESVSADVFLVPETARFLVISDIDDTVICTGVANKLKMLYRLFVQKTQSRTAFPGVATFYQALHEGISESELNPMIYVSRGPWGIYEILTEFFNLHRIPCGPILFLRYWGLDFYHPLPRRAKDHKLNLIRTMFEINDTLPVILIGDSGQKDAEIYTHIVKEYPGRVLAIYIRDVGRSRQRLKTIGMLAGQVITAGSRLILAKDSFTMAKHAAANGLISSQALFQILTEDHTSLETK